jgi:hypothetical protein
MASDRPGWADSMIPITMQAIVTTSSQRLAQDLDDMAPELWQLIEEEDVRRASDTSTGSSVGSRLYL